MFQFADANNTYSNTDYYNALFNPNNSHTAVQQWCQIHVGCYSSRFFWMMDDGETDLSPKLPDPVSPPSITLLGSATTTAEFGSVFSDPGATAQDDIDGDITSAIQLIGTVDTGIMGTTTLTYSITDSQGLSATTTRAVVVACTHDCNSSVLFLPGIEGSRLYEGTGCGKAAEEKLWDPVADSFLGKVFGVLFGSGDASVGELALDSAGKSDCSDIYTKEGDVIDSVGGGGIYESFISEMDGLKSDSTIADWKPVSYDWRLSLDDLLSNGTQHGDKIYYNEATSTPYIEQTLRALAKSSKTGKVTIVSHSNGGLVTKALLNKLGSEASNSLVDKVIMVGVPQSGAPASVGSLLVGYNAGIYLDIKKLEDAVTVVSNQAARTFSQNSPMAYHLLPSSKYLESVIQEPTHPVVHFAGDGYAKERAAYGNSIVDIDTLDDFLVASHGEREKPTVGNLRAAEILSQSLIDYANGVHSVLDAWAPPEGIEVNQIAGWGVDTVAGVDFYTQPATDVLTALEPLRDYRPITIEDGDGTVPVPSALMMPESANVKRYWLDLHSYNKLAPAIRKHPDLFEISSLQDFIKNLIVNSTSTLPAYIYSSQPATQDTTKKLTFFLHSPLTLQITDSSGHVTGITTDGTMTQDIPGSTYSEFGEVKYVTVPEGDYQLTMHGQASGTFSLDIQESSGGVVTTTSTIANVPTTASTLVSLTISGGIDTVSALTVDENGDGTDVMTVDFKSGETAVYTPVLEEPEATEPVPAPVRAASGAASYLPEISTSQDSVSAPAVANTSDAQIAPALATTTIPGVVVATTTLVATTTFEVIEPERPIVVARSSKKSPVQSRVIAEAPDETHIQPQTAAVYDAVSQQPFLQKWGTAVYNGLHSLWSALKKFF